MSLVSLTLPSDGSAATAASVNGPFQALANVINGNLDSSNISSLSGSKIQSGTLSGSSFDTSTSGGWLSVGQTFTYTGNNGNKEFTGTFPADMTSTLSPGMRMKFTRSTTPPTQCMSFTAASSQYATKSSPSGITFTSAFTCEAWIYLLSYTGNRAEIINRMDGGFTTGGWQMELSSSGQVVVQYGTSSSFTGWQSYQSIPLNRWVHIAAAVSSTSSKTLGGIYINGISVPTSQIASSATSLTQASVDLRLGAFSSTPTNSYLNGYLSEVRLWSVAQSQSSIQANMAISLTGSETNLVALFQGNGNFNDKTANANNLTATNGAIATQAANPYNATEYAIITNVGAYSGGTTPITLFTGTDNNIPNMVLNNASYSTQRSPFGFTASKNKWVVDTVSAAQLSGPYSGVSIWANTNLQLTVPTGEWVVGYSGNLEEVSTVSGARDSLWRLSSTTPSGNSTQELTSYIYGGSGSAVISNTERSRPQSLTATTAYTFYTMIQSATGSESWYLRGEIGNTRLWAECAYI